MHESDQFTETGSGQTQGKALKNITAVCFSQGNTPGNCKPAELQQLAWYHNALRGNITQAQAAFGTRDGHFLTSCERSDQAMLSSACFHAELIMLSSSCCHAELILLS